MSSRDSFDGQEVDSSQAKVRADRASGLSALCVRAQPGRRPKSENPLEAYNRSALPTGSCSLP